MKKVFLIVLLILAASAVTAEPLDFIVLLDVSESMLRYFDDTVNYLIRDILQQHLSSSDGFHLLTFADSPGIELTLAVEGSGDVDEALSRILLLQPLGKYTDLVSALKYVYSYTGGVRQDSRKKILILTDGIHDPPPGSPYPVDGNIYKTTLTEVAQNIRKKGWEVSLVQFPAQSPAKSLEDKQAPEEDITSSDSVKTGDAIAASEEASDKNQDKADAQDRSGDDIGEKETAGDVYPDLAEELDVEVLPYTEPDEDTHHRAIGAPQLIFPEDLGKVRHTFTLPLTVRNLSDERILVELVEIIWNGIDLLKKPVSVTVEGEKQKKLPARLHLPSSLEPGQMSLDLAAGFADDLRIYPREGTVSITLRGGNVTAVSRSTTLLPVLTYIGIAIGGALALVFLFFAVRSLVSRISTIGAASMSTHHGSPSERSIELYVEGQNPNIGTRNVHYIRKNTSASVGGGFSNFLIYMYRLPPRIGLVSRKEERYTFSPVKPEFFENAGEVVDCLNKDITVVCSSGRKVTIRFRKYVSELEKINMLMRSIRKPEPGEDES